MILKIILKILWMYLRRYFCFSSDEGEEEEKEEKKETRDNIHFNNVSWYGSHRCQNAKNIERLFAQVSAPCANDRWAINKRRNLAFGRQSSMSQNPRGGVLRASFPFPSQNNALWSRQPVKGPFPLDPHAAPRGCFVIFHTMPIDFRGIPADNFDPPTSTTPFLD